MRAQTERSLEDADVALLVVDAREGITPADRHFARWLRRTGRPVVLIANKAEGRRGLAGATEACALGLGDPVPISAQQGAGTAELYERLRPSGDDGGRPGAEAEAERRPQPATVGRPN